MENENKVNYLGVCPVCGKGQIAEGPTVYRCNYAKSMDDKCDFRILKTYNGAEIKPEHVKQLIKDRKTELLDFVSKEGKKYQAQLIIKENGEIGIEFPFNENNLEKLNTPCPVCGGIVYVYNKGYGCKNLHETDENGDKVCQFWLSKTICGREITKSEAEDLLRNGETDFLDGFTNNNGDNFTSKMVLRDEKVVFDSVVCKCPKCGGDIRIGNKAYNCSNYKTTGCKFSIWREIKGHKLTPDEAKMLCEEKQTPVIEFKSKDGSKTFNGQLTLNDDYNVVVL